MPDMIVLEVEGRRVVAEPTRPLVIGRAPEATVTVSAPTVSRQHLQVSFDGGRWWGRDLGTLNGTFVNGSRVASDRPFPLLPGMALVLGTPADGLRVGVHEAGRPPVPSVPTPMDHGDGLDPADGLTVNLSALTVVRGQGPDAEGARTTTRGFVPKNDVLTIGRGPGNAIVVHDPLVSVLHARLSRLGAGRWRVEDLNSTNGTFVNGVRVRAQEVALGDVVTVGKMFLRVTRDGLQRIAQAGAAGPVGAGPSGAGATPGPRPAPPALSVSAVTFTVPTNRAERDKGADKRKRLLDRVTFHVPPRSLLAVIGPSGAGKSTMLKSMTGALRPDEGQVLFTGLDMAVFADSLAHRVGMVPQDDVVHTELTARQALTYAARLRFPDDTTPQEQAAAVDWTIKELGLTAHADTKIRQMSGGQRKRVSTAMELLTRPDLLFLDEPTSGLDPNLDREVMELLRDLAHGSPQSPQGRTIVVITHSTANLDKADNVLLLAPGGKVAYFGPPAGLQDFFAGPLRGDRSFASIYELIARAPDAAQAAFAGTPLAQRPFPYLQPHPAALAQASGAPRKRLLPQTATLLSRQARLLVADRSLLVFTAVLPVVMALVTLAVGAPDGLSPASEMKRVGDPRILLVVLVFGAVLMGIVPAVRQLVGERPIYLREAGIGVRPGAYLASKVLLLGVVSLIQSVLLVAVALAVNPHPAQGLFAPLIVELTIMVFAVAWVSASVGLLLSAVVSTSEQVMPLMVVVLMLQLVLCGGVFSVTGPGVNQASWLVPSRWGYAVGASSLDFNVNVVCRQQVLAKAKEDEEVNRQAREATDKANTEAADSARARGLPAPTPREPEVRRSVVDCGTVEDTDPLWEASLPVWLGGLGVLALFFVAANGGTFAVLRRQAR